jgi:acetyl esterase
MSLQYRLAPEHPWPASVDDTVAALRWIASRDDGELDAMSGAVVVAGDSSGGALATLACLRLRDEDDREAMPGLQALVYPNTDLSGSLPSMTEKESGFGLDVATVTFFNSQWVPDRSRWADPGVSALFAEDVAGQPPAVVVTAEHDPLRDEGAAYAERLRDAGLLFAYRCEPGMTHNFMMLDDISPAAAAAGDRVAADIRRWLTSAGTTPH